MSDKPDNDGDEGAPNPFNPKRLRLSQRFTQGTDVKRALITVPVRKPSAQDFFRVHPDEEWRLDTALIEIKADREVYLVDPEIWPLFPNECKPRTLYTTIDIFAFLSAWFGGDLSADVNGSSAVTLQDVFDFLTMWFGQCV